MEAGLKGKSSKMRRSCAEFQVFRIYKFTVYVNPNPHCLKAITKLTASGWKEILQPGHPLHSGVNDPAETVSAGSLALLKFEYCRFSRRIRGYMRNGLRPWIRALCGVDWWKKNKGRKSCATFPLKLDARGSRFFDFFGFSISCSLQLMGKTILRLKYKRCFSLFPCLPMRKWVF
jgi:hypothetical protein